MVTGLVAIWVGVVDLAVRGVGTELRRVTSVTGGLGVLGHRRLIPKAEELLTHRRLNFLYVHKSSAIVHRQTHVCMHTIYQQMKT